MQYMLEKAFRAARLDWRFLTFEVPSCDFEGALRGVRIFGFRGIVLAPPHRSPVLPYLEQMSQVCRISDQVNCVQQIDGQLHGHNTEGRALRLLVQRATDLAGAQVTILGAGRLARSIAAELALIEVGEIAIACRQPETIDDLLASIKEAAPNVNCRVMSLSESDELEVASDCRLLVNATSLGRQQPYEQLPVPVDNLPTGTLVADVVYNPPGTWLVREATRNGHPTVDGLSLLIEQAALAFEIWTGVTADRHAMREAVEEFLVL